VKPNTQAWPSGSILRIFPEYRRLYAMLALVQEERDLLIERAEKSAAEATALQSELIDALKRLQSTSTNSQTERKQN